MSRFGVQNALLVRVFGAFFISGSSRDLLGVVLYYWAAANWFGPGGHKSPKSISVRVQLQFLTPLAGVGRPLRSDQTKLAVKTRCSTQNMVCPRCIESVQHLLKSWYQPTRLTGPAT